MTHRSPTVYTIGHGTLTFDEFLHLLDRYGIQEVIDIRSIPYSKKKYTDTKVGSHENDASGTFDRETLELKLATPAHGRQTRIRYSFLGDLLGGRPKDPTMYRPDGKADYEKIANSESFRKGVQIVLRKAAANKVALLCAEKQPERCHRAILVGKVLHDMGVDVQHILHNGALKSQSELLERDLLGGVGILFPEKIEQAYDALARKIAKTRIGTK